jgi:glycosyltransferase involved in cell wall biosynthesis
MQAVFNIKIAQVCHRYHPFLGGVETHVEEISKRLASEGFKIEVLTVDTSGMLESERVYQGVSIKRFKSLSPRSISEVYYPSLTLWQYLRNNSYKYDVIHAHNYHALPSLYAASTKSINNFVFTPHYHGAGGSAFRNLLHIPYRLLGQRIFDKADKIICVSNYEKYLVNKLDVDEKKIVVIPNGLNLDQYKGLQRNKRDFKSILYVGRIEKYKGIQFILEAVANLDENIIAEIVGIGPYKSELMKLATAMGIGKRVRFYDNLPRKQLLEKYIDAEIFIMLSIRESYGITVAEALSLGTPCIVSNYSALREWVDGRNCFGIDYPPDINKLVELIKKVSGRTVDHMCTQKRTPSWDYVTEKIIKIYENLEK